VDSETNRAKETVAWTASPTAAVLRWAATTFGSFWTIVPFPNPAGRPKGSRNKVSEKLLEALAIDFDDHGKEVIEKVRIERPADYLKIVASLVPKQMEIDDLRTSRRAEDLSDNELAAIATERFNGHPQLDG
jgi:hypothetical protein